MVAYTNMSAAWRENRGFAALVLGYVVIAEMLARAVGFDHVLDIYGTPLLLHSAAGFVIVLSGATLWTLIRHRPSRPFGFVWQQMVGPWRLGERAAMALPVALLVPVFMSSFTSVKSAIGLMHPHNLDPLLIEMEAALYGGQAWALLPPWLLSPEAVAAADFIYNLWFLVMSAVLAVVAVQLGGALRKQYLAAFVLTWALLGTAGAIALSSVGPCFFGLAYPELADPFAPLMESLRAAQAHYPMMAFTTVQDALWQGLSHATPGLGHGISAAPSLHVAVAMLNAILGWKISQLAGVAATAFLGTILIGSVMLGWHYSIDGYISILAVPLIWVLAGWTVGARRGPITKPAAAE